MRRKCYETLSSDGVRCKSKCNQRRAFNLTRHDDRLMLMNVSDPRNLSVPVEHFPRPLTNDAWEANEGVINIHTEDADFPLSEPDPFH
ncbi:hypothetical protein NPIL_526301 [Nephila pilipes]|uniref:Uncharacterized protein n=1 Tax=Nephila pilipes TaxID=299642 RepID=A0A8X6PVZ6_NEPPI|nr:hypothetical protein NPIL_526301 [Nephila pilipes]